MESDETQVSHGSGSAWITCGKISSKKNKWDKERKSSLKSFCFIPAADQIQKCFCSVMQILRSWDDWQKAEMRNKRAGNWDMRVLRLHYTATSQTGSNSDGSFRNNRHHNINFLPSFLHFFQLACFSHKYFYPPAAGGSWRPQWWQGWGGWPAPRGRASGQETWSLQHMMVVMVEY